MGAAEGRSMFYLEARCVALARAIGSQGVQNGGIDSAAVAGSVPGGVRSLMAENVMVMVRNLEACTGNDALMSESDVRRTSRTLPDPAGRLGLRLQRVRLDPALRQHVRPEPVERRGHRRLPGDAARLGRRRRAAHRRGAGTSRRCGPGRSTPCAPSTGTSVSATSTTSWAAQAVDAAGSKDVPAAELMTPLVASRVIRETGLTMIDVVAALYETGFEAGGRPACWRCSRPGSRATTCRRRPSSTSRSGCCRSSPTPTTTPARAPGTSPRRRGRPRSTRSGSSASVEDLRAEQAGPPVGRAARGRAGDGGQRPARGRRRGLARGRPRGVGDAVRADRRARRCASCWPAWRRRAASAGWCGSTTPSTSA